MKHPTTPPTSRPTRALALAAACLFAFAAPATAHDDDEPMPAELAADPSDGPAYPVSGIRLEISSSQPDHPALVALSDFRLKLGQVADGYVAPRKGVPEADVPLVAAPFTNYYASAVQAIGLQLTNHLKDEGLDNVLVYAAEEEIDPETGRDLRARGQLTLHFLVRAEPHKRRGWFD